MRLPMVLRSPHRGEEHADDLDARVDEEEHECVHSDVVLSAERDDDELGETK